jgi:SP family xylose:H+ symportor-like MFS transporter
MLHVIQQFTGINIIQYYGPAVLKDAGFAGDSNTDLLYSMIFLSSVNTVGNFIGLSLSSKYGRRELIMKSMIPMGISLIILAGAMVVNTTMSSPVTRQCNKHVILKSF